MRRRVARLLGVLGGLLLLVVLAIIASPLWFPWIARPLAARAGLRYAEYDRQGYSTFKLRKAKLEQGGIVFEAEEVSGFTPLVWLWKQRNGRLDVPFLRVTGWSLRFPERKGVRTTPPKAPRQPQLREVTKYPGKIERWLPSALLANGVVHMGGRLIQVPDIAWKAGRIEGSATLDKTPGTATFAIDVSSLPYSLHAKVDPLEVQTDLSLSTNAAGLFVSGSVQWKTNCAYLQAQLPASGLIPEHAEILATNVVIPGSLLGAKDYEAVRADLEGRWSNGAYQIKLGTSASSETAGMPPVVADFQIVGTTNKAVIEKALVRAPGIVAELSRGVSLMPRAPWLVEPAELNASLDFSRLDLKRLSCPWPVTGTAQGRVVVTPALKQYPAAKFSLTASDVKCQELVIASLETDGLFTWPELRISTLRAQLWSGTVVGLSGNCDLSNRVIGTAALHVSSREKPPLLPKDVGWSSLSITGNVSGPFTAPQHSGRLKASSVLLGKTGAPESSGVVLLPISLPEVSFDWAGRKLDLSRVQLDARSISNQISLTGAFSVGTNSFRAKLEKLAFSGTNRPALVLQKPAELFFRPGRDWTVQASEVALAGPGQELRFIGGVNWPRDGRIELSASGLRSEVLDEFLRLEKLNLRSLSASAAWTNGPVAFVLNTDVHSSRANLPFALEARLAGNGRGINIQQAALTSSNSPLVLASGHLPVSFLPAGTNLLVLDPSGPVNFRGSVQPHAFVWDYLAETTGWRISNPEVLAEISGTWSAPQAVAQVKARQIVPGKRFAGAPWLTNLPALGPLNLVIRAEEGKAVIDPLEIEVQGQQLTAKAEIPLRHLPYKDLRSFAKWDRASAHVRVPSASIAAFQPFASKIVAPEGEIEMDIVLQPGFRIGGNVIVRGARTVPIGTLGPVRDISLSVRLGNELAILESGRARIGGVPITVTGQGEFSATNLALTSFRLAAKGSKVPIARQPQAIIRGDVDILILKTNQAEPVIRGTVQMRDSFFLSDLAALIPGKVVNPRERPPYFSITDKPIATWGLDVQVSGDRGLRMRTPVVAGEVTPNLRLGGTLREPVAVGNVRVDSGILRFPFGSLEIRQGLVTLSTQDPTRPQVSLTAGARQFGYDVRLDVSGPVNEPVLQFSSTPALSSDEVLMMLTAGELPRGIGALTAQQRAQSFAMFIGRDLLSKLGMGEQAGERLVVRSGEEFSEEGRPTYDVEYRLTPRWSVTGEYDRFGDFNAGFKWRVFSK